MFLFRARPVLVPLFLFAAFTAWAQPGKPKTKVVLYKDRIAAQWDTVNCVKNVIKANPLLDWTREDAVDFASAHAAPINPLHGKGFLSIGCAPCTRAVQPGESERAGRWWWEDEAKKECGLHITADGRIVRAAQLETAS